MSITIGIVDVLFVQADAVKTKGSVSASADLALGLCLLVFGALVATDRVGRRHTPAEEAKGQSWSDRMLGHPRLGLAFVIGALAGASYILGLKQLDQSNDPAGLQVVGVLLFCLIQFSAMIIPFLCLELWPEGTKTRLRALNALRGRASILALRGNVIYGSAAGLTSVGDQFWSQNSPGVAGDGGGG